jgi:hypothetical protein
LKNVGGASDDDVCVGLFPFPVVIPLASLPVGFDSPMVGGLDSSMIGGFMGAAMGGGIKSSPGGNKYLGGLSKKRNRGFVDVFKNSQSSPSLSNNNAPPPSELFMPPPMAAPMNPPIMDESNPPTMGESNPTGSDANGMTTGNGNNPTQTSSSDAPPTFFNPNSYSVAAPTTRRNKY